MPMRTPPALSFTFEIRAQVGPPLQVGRTPRGERRIVSITGGTFEGPSIRGRVLPGADWQLVHEDGFTELDTRYALETSEGDLIYVQNAGVRDAPAEVMAELLAGRPVDPAAVYFRTVPRFETSAPHLQTLVRSTFVGAGERYPSDVVIRVWRVD
jgi:hypothetical protein